MNANYLLASKKSLLHGKHDYYISSNYDEKCVKFLPKLSYKQIYDLSANYPKDDYRGLKESIKSLFGIKNIILSTGCEDLIIKICTSIDKNKSKVGVILPTFYRITDNLTKFVQIKWDSFEKTDYKNLDYVFIVNPNTLNGQTVSKTALLNIVENNSNTIFIIDETSILFLENWKEVTLASIANKYNNLLVISSLSKFFGLSGHRIGFATGSLKLLKTLNLELETFPISNLSSFIAQSILMNNDYIKFVKDRILKNKKEITNLIIKSEKVGLQDSTNNCVYCYSKNSTRLHKTLESHGIIGLDLDCQKGITKKGLVRLTIHGSDTNHRLLVNKLKQII